MRQLVIPASARGLRGMNFVSDPCVRRRHIHGTPPVLRSVKDKLSEVADKVNKKVGEGLATAIETGEKATQKTKETLGGTTKHAKDKAEGAKEGQKAKETGSDVAAAVKETGGNAHKGV